MHTNLYGMLLIQFANRMYHRCKFVRKYIHMYYDCEVWSLVRVLTATHAQHFLKRKHTHLCVCNTKSYSSSQNVKSIIEHIVGCVMMPLYKQVSCVFVCCMNMLLGVGDSGEGAFRLPIGERISGSGDDRRKLSGVGNLLEIANIVLILHGRPEGSVDLQVLESLDGDSAKPFVADDISGTGLQITVTLGKIGCQQLLAECLGVLVKILWEVDLAGKNLLVDSHRLVIAERWLSDNHLINKDSQGPPVDRLAVTLVEQHLGGDILGSAAKRVGTATGLDDLGETKIGQLAVSVVAQEKILGLQIAVNDVLVVDVLEGEGDLEGVELGLLIGELAVLTKMSEQLTTGHDLHNNKDVMVILEGGNHGHDEGGVQLVHERALGVDMIDLLELDDLMLLHELTGVGFAGLLVLGKLDTTERTAPEGSDHFEVRKEHLARDFGSGDHG